jgi:TPR repeat protein
MRSIGISSSLILRRLVFPLVLPAFLLLPNAYGQRLTGQPAPAARACPLTGPGHLPEDARGDYDPQSISAADSPTPDPELTQMGIASALVLAPGRTLFDARQRLEKAARKGYAPAQVNLGVFYLYGCGTPQNYGAALYWLISAADLGSSSAHTNLGILYLQGKGVKQDFGEALRHFRVAANAGDAGAMVNLGYMNDSGLGTPVDHAAAAEWYRQAAERGDSLAQNNLADLYLRGEGLPQNDVLAFAWFEKAAASGNTGARIKLGFMYATGRATRKDPEAAYAWILAASLAGDQRGVEYLLRLESQLSPAQLEQAKRRAKELRSTGEAPVSELAFVQ